MNIGNSYEMKSAMRRCGFLPLEIDSFMKAKVPGASGKMQDVVKIGNSKPFNDMLKHRATFCMELKRKGIGKVEIMSRIKQHYNNSDKKNSPWDFLKAEYRPPRKLNGKEFESALKARNIARTNTSDIGKFSGSKNIRYKPVIKDVPK